jgi:hypothetical protein
MSGIGPVKYLTVDLYATGCAWSESGENFDEFALTVSSNSCDRHDLTAADIERYGAERRQASIAIG